MTGWRTDVEVQGIEPAQRVLRRISNLGEDIEKPLARVGDLIRTTVVERFEGERGPGNIPWPKSKRAEGKAPNARGVKMPGKTLVDTGDLRQSLHVESRTKEVEVGFQGLRNPVKARANQFGSHGQSVVLAHTRVIHSAFGVPLPKPKEVKVRAHGRITNLPARPMLGMDSELAEGIEEVLMISLLDLLNG